MKRLDTLFKRFAIKSIELYAHIRPLLDQVCLSVFGVSIACKHSPSCSAYTIQSIKSHGTIEGLYRGISRIIRCY